MKRCIGLGILALVLASGQQAQAAYVNVAAGKSVSASGSVYGAALSTLTDGVFLPESTGWTSGTVYWYGSAPVIQIDLGALHTIEAATIQADDNDSYRLEYFDGSSWNTLWNVPNYDAYGWGMTTRPSPGNWQVLSSVTTDKVRFYATGGDSSYSVSEIQLGGARVPVGIVPLPSAAWAGLGLLSVLGGTRMVRRRAA